MTSSCDAVPLNSASELAMVFLKKYDLDADVIKLNLYKKPNPNMYLASFAEFIFTNEDVDNYFHGMLKEGVSKFIEYRILCFKEAHDVPVHFVGSIAHFTEDIIRECMASFDLKLGAIIRRPINGLITYYKSYKRTLE